MSLNIQPGKNVCCTKQDKTFLIEDYNRASIKVNALAEKECPRLKKESQIETLPATQIKEDTLTVTLLSTRFSRKHLDDILMDKHLISYHILGFAET